VCDPDYLYQVGMHYSESWGKLTSLISGLDLRLAKIKPFVAGGSQNPPIGNLPHGLPSVQLRDLDELYRAKHPCRQCGNSGAFGGVEDCPKAHVVIDNRGLPAGSDVVNDPE
jgi:hypothetical protein